MEEQQQRVEQPGQGQDPLGLDRAHFAQELQELGLLEFAEEVNFNRLTENPGDASLPSASARPGQGGSAPVGHNNPPPQPTQPLDIHHCHLANQAADMATARAIQVLHLAKLSLNQLVHSYNPRAAGSGATDGSSKRRKTSRGADAGSSRSGSKGLRHFSMKVCEKVEAKGRTTYNEVADELVSEMSKMEAVNKSGQYDEKNIRRRVYDAINVLMAMDIIQKEKKEITWKGFPRLGNHSLEKLKADRQARIKEVEQKQLYLQDMIEQQKALKKLLERSTTRGPNATGTQLFLPFILVQAKPDATVEVKISEDMMDVQFDFYNSPFQIHDDSHVLKKMAEHQAKQQQQQQPPAQQPPFNPLAGGLALSWQAPNGNLLAAAAAALSPISDPNLQLAVAAAQAQAQAQGTALAYGYPPAAAAAAAYYQQQQQQLLQQQQGQGQGQSGQGGQQQGQQQQGQQQQQQQQQQQGQQQQAQQGQQQQQAQQTQAQQTSHSGQHPQSGQPPQQGQQPQVSQVAAQQQLQQQHSQLQSQQLQTLQALQAQIQQQQLQAQLHAARASMPGAVALPTLGVPLSQQVLPGGQVAAPSFGVAHAVSAAPAPHLPQTSQLAGQLATSLQTGAGTGTAGAGASSGLPVGGLTSHPPPQPHLGLPPLSQAPQLGALLPLPHMPPGLVAALGQAQAQTAVGHPPSAPQPGGPSSAASPGAVGQVAGAMQPPAQLGLQLAGPAAPAAFPLVA